MSHEYRTRKMLADIRCIYLAVYIAVYALLSSTPIASMNIGLLNMAWSAMGVLGVLLLAVDFAYRRVLFTARYCGLLMCFLASMFVSIILNAKYGLMGNIKALLWMCIQFFLMLSVDTEVGERTHWKHLRLLMGVFSVIWFVLACWSLGQFVMQYSQSLPVMVDGVEYLRRVGYTEGRLFGVFSDPNYASVCSAAAIVYALVDIISLPRSTPRRIFDVFQIIVQFCYVILAASRTAQVAILAAVVFLTIVLSLRFVESHTRKTYIQIGIILLAVILVVSISIFCFCVLKTGLSYLPGIVTGEQNLVDMERPDVVNSSDVSNNRFAIYSSYIEIASSAPLFGLSPRNILDYVQEFYPDSFIAKTEYSVHCGYLSLFVCTGAVGAVIMLLWMALIAIEIVGWLFRNRNSGGEAFYKILFLTAFLLISAVSALPLQMLFFSNVIYDVLFWVTLGYVRAFIRMSEPERYEKMPLPYRLTERVFARFKKPQKAE